MLYTCVLSCRARANCSAAVAPGGGEREAGAAPHRPQRGGADGEASGQGRLPRVLRRQDGAVHREAVAQVRDVVGGGRPSCKRRGPRVRLQQQHHPGPLPLPLSPIAPYSSRLDASD